MLTLIITLLLISMVSFALFRLDAQNKGHITKGFFIDCLVFLIALVALPALLVMALLTGDGNGKKGLIK
jgi:hypothetical protein